MTYAFSCVISKLSIKTTAWDPVTQFPIRAKVALELKELPGGIITNIDEAEEADTIV